MGSDIGLPDPVSNYSVTFQYQISNPVSAAPRRQARESLILLPFFCYTVSDPAETNILGEPSIDCTESERDL